MRGSLWGGALALLLLLGGPRAGRAYAPFFEGSPYAVRRNWSEPRLPAGLDASAPGAVEQIVAALARNKELILFTFTDSGWWLEWAVNFYKQLDAVGYQHALALATPAACARARAALPHAECASLTLSGAHWESDHSIDYGWIGRYLLASRLARAGASVLVLDVDCLLRRDVYAELHAPPQSAAQLLHLEEGFANGGVFYLRAPAAGPAGWTHDEVWRRGEAIKRMGAEPGGFSGTAMDQALLNDALNSASAPNGSAHDWPSTYVTGERHHSHPFWTEGPMERGRRSARRPGDRWYAADWALAPQGGAEGERAKALALASCGATEMDPGACAPATPCAAAADALPRAPFKTLALRLPGDSEERAALVAAGRLAEADAVDTFAAGLHTTFTSALSERAHCGFAAVTHLVAAACDWGEAGAWTHSGRRALMAAGGAWMPAALGAAPLLGGAGGEVAGRGRLYLSLADGVVAAGGTATKAQVGATLRRLFAAAFALGRVPAVFGWECGDPGASPWLARSPTARLGVYDHRVVKHGTRCYPAPGGQRCWWDTWAYAFEVPQPTVAPRTLRSFDEAAAMTAHDVRLRHLPEAQEPVDPRLRADCPEWFQ